MMCKEKWGSVRKIKYISDILASIEFSSKYNNKKYDPQLYSKYLVNYRLSRINLINLHYNKISTRTSNSLFNTKFKSTLSDNLTFMKNMDIFYVNSDGVIINKGLNINNGWEKINKIIITNIFKSKYNAYKCFLMYLDSNKELVIIKSKLKRNEEFTEHINNMGIYTDVASFYTIRDLFYELGLINWLMTKNGNLVIFPTASFSDKFGWNDSIQLENILYINKKTDLSLFYNTLIEVYLKNVNEYYGIDADLLQVRDDVCYALRISDQSFLNLLYAVINLRQKKHIIEVSYGPVSSHKLNYGNKIVTLPKIHDDKLALYIRIKEVKL